MRAMLRPLLRRQHPPRSGAGSNRFWISGQNLGLSPAGHNPRFVPAPEKSLARHRPCVAVIPA